MGDIDTAAGDLARDAFHAGFKAAPKCAGRMTYPPIANWSDVRLKDAIRENLDLVEQRDRYQADLQDIGRMIGCDHIDDGLARCVRETLEPALDLARAVARLNPAAGEIGAGIQLGHSRRRSRT